MILKAISLTTSLAHTTLLVLMIALGSQNLSSKHNINLGLTTTEAYPSGFLIGISIALGSLSGALTTALIIPSENNTY